VGEFPLHAEEEFQALGVAGEQPAFEQVEGQDFQARDALRALAVRHHRIITSFPRTAVSS